MSLRPRWQLKSGKREIFSAILLLLLVTAGALLWREDFEAFGTSGIPEEHLIPGYATGKGLVLYSDLAYSSLGNEHTFDLITPSDYRQAKHPALIWIHGGGWAEGDKTNPLPEAAALTAAKLGFVTFNVNYRLNRPDRPNPFPAATEDINAFAQYLSANLKEFNLDESTPISIGGQSAGGHLALFAATDIRSPFRYRCLVDISGITDLNASNFPRSLQPYINSFASTYELRAEASPLIHLHNLRVDKVFIVQAEDDEVVPITQSKLLHQQLISLTKPPPVQFIDLIRGGHELSPGTVHRELNSFLAKACA